MSWWALFVKQNIICSFPQLDYVRQPNVNDWWPSMMVNLSALWLLLSIYSVLKLFYTERLKNALEKLWV